MAAYRQVYDSHHLQANYQEPGTLRSAIEYWLPLLFLLLIIYVVSEKKQSVIHLPTLLEKAPH